MPSWFPPPKVPSDFLLMTGAVAAFTNVSDEEVNGSFVDPGGTGTTTSFTYGIWLFAADDGSSSDLMFSVEAGDKNSSVAPYGLWVARIDPLDTASYASVSWYYVETGVTSISDHFHIFAHGAHWLTFAETDSDGNATDLHLVRFEDTDPSSTGSSSAGAPDAVVGISTTDSTRTTGLVTGVDWGLNDPFVVDTPSGVAMGVWDPYDSSIPASPLKLVSVDTSLAYEDTASYYFPSDAPPVNLMGMAIRQPLAGRSYIEVAGLQGTYLVVTPRYITEGHAVDSYAPYGNGIDLGLALTDWSLVDTTPVVSIERSADADGLIKPTIVLFPNGWFAITYLYQDDAIRSGGTTSGAIGQTLMRNLYRDDTALVSTEVLRSATSTRSWGRPYSMRWGDYLITTYDEIGNSKDGFTYRVTHGCRIRVDQIHSYLLS